MTSGKQRGFTLIEVTIILMALAILAAILVPSVGSLNSLARKVRMKEDLGVLCSSLKIMLDDLGASAFFDSFSQGSVAVRGASYGGSYAATGGRTTFRQETEFDVDDGWCEDCARRARDCGPDCIDDCGPDCVGRDHCGPDCVARRSRTDVTTQTYGYESGTTYSGSSGGSYSYAATGSGGGFGLHGFPVGLLVGDGDIPGSAIGATQWQLELGSRFSATTHGFFPVTLQFAVATFADQLIHGDPTLHHGARAAGLAASRSRFGGSARGGLVRGRGASVQGSHLIRNRHFRWRGPYIADAIAPDPWGNRYMANVFGLHAPPAHLYPANLGTRAYVEGFTSAAVCYSAGPNGLIETHFDQPFGWYTGGDDVTVVLAGAGGIR